MPMWKIKKRENRYIQIIKFAAAIVYLHIDKYVMYFNKFEAIS